MGNFSWSGILLILGIFFTIVTFLLVQIDVEHPITGMETSIFNLVIGWIINIVP